MRGPFRITMRKTADPPWDASDRHRCSGISGKSEPHFLLLCPVHQQEYTFLRLSGRPLDSTTQASTKSTISLPFTFTFTRFQNQLTLRATRTSYPNATRMKDIVQTKHTTLMSHFVDISRKSGRTFIPLRSSSRKHFDSNLPQSWSNQSQQASQSMLRSEP